jgi:hypothetical protein
MRGMLRATVDTIELKIPGQHSKPSTIILLLQLLFSFQSISYLYQTNPLLLFSSSSQALSDCHEAERSRLCASIEREREQVEVDIAQLRKEGVSQLQTAEAAWKVKSGTASAESCVVLLRNTGIGSRCHAMLTVCVCVLLI